jgi:hypothetical protein
MIYQMYSELLIIDLLSMLKENMQEYIKYYIVILMMLIIQTIMILCIINL